MPDSNHLLFKLNNMDEHAKSLCALVALFKARFGIFWGDGDT